METANNPPVENDDLETQAIHWVVRLTSGEAGPEELRKFDAWRRTSADHEAAVRRARELWLRLEKAPALANRANVPITAAVVPLPVKIVRHHWRMALAAMLVLAIGVGQWQSHWQYTYATGTGSPRSYLLADGSTVWLDADSAVDVRIRDGQRQVVLARGRAFFDVAHDPAHPFTVDAGLGNVRVLGTAFAVQRKQDEVVVTVERGKVLVNGGDAPAVTLTADEEVSVRPGERSRAMLQVDARRRTTWHRGWLTFEGQSLTEIIKTLKRYDNRLVVVTHPDTDKLRMDAMIQLNQLNDWYDGLERSSAVRVKRIGPLVWIR